MKIIERKVEELVPYENNPRNNENAVEYVANSIKEFGFKVPIIVDCNNVIVAGHTRLLAAKRLGLEKVPCIVADDLNEEQIKAFRLADNKVSEYATWDFEKLELELEKLDFEMTEFGFDEIDEEESAEIIEDEVPEVPEEPKAKLGDIYQLGNHRLMCGDSTKEEDVAKLMNDTKADMVFTDPPYNANYKSRGNNMTLREGIINDNMSDKKFNLFIENFMSSISISIKKGGSIYICCNWKDSYPRMYFECLKKNFNVSNCIVWNKKSAGMGWQDYRYQYEFIIYGFDNQKGHNFYGDRTQTDIWECAREVKQKYVHPTQKPIQIPAKAIENSSKKGDIVLDLFGGSGSTLIACEQTNRKCLMMEYDPKFVDVIIERWEKLTGKKAVLINDRKS